MIGYVSGVVKAVSDKHIIVDVNGVGYRITIPEKIRNSIAKIGSAVKLFTHWSLSPHDGSVELYGFTTPEELNFFELLTTISGIGPKSAQGILSSTDLQALQIGIVRGDEKYLRKISGISEKTAQRLIIELKNKIKVIHGGQLGDLGADSDAIDALVALGYSQRQALEVLKEVGGKAKTSEEKVKEALKLLGSNK